MTRLRLVLLAALALAAGCHDPMTVAYQALAAHTEMCERDSIKWQRSADGQTFTVICEARKK